MKKLTLILALSLATIFSNAQSPAWQWAKSAGGSSGDGGYSIAVDGSGNSYVTGYFRSTSITFGSTTLTNTGVSSYDMFIVKYDASGTVVWAKSAGGSSDDVGNGIALDGSGNIYVTGYFQSSSIIFGSTTLTNVGSWDIFIAKYDVSGTVVWAKKAGGSSVDDGIGITVDVSGNSYITGSFASSSIIFGSTTLTNAGGSDVFIVKYNTSGTVLWAKRAGGIDYDQGRNITVDGSGNSYITGGFNSSSIIFGSTTLTNDTTNGSADMYNVKYDPSGTVVWAKSAGGSGADVGNSIAVDGTGNTYLTGVLTSYSITFGSTILTNASSGNADIFIVKYDASGAVSWAKSAGANSFDYGSSIMVDISGNSYVTGYFRSASITFGSTVLTNAGASGDDIFIMTYDPSGTALWAKSVGGSGTDWGSGIAVDGSGNTFITGQFNSPTITFGSSTLTNIGSADMFIAKLPSTTVGINENVIEENEIHVYPNPFSSQTTISFSVEQRNTTIKIIDAVGREIKTINFNGKQLIIEKELMQTGIYFVQIIDSNKNVINKKIVCYSPRI